MPQETLERLSARDQLCTRAQLHSMWKSGLVCTCLQVSFLCTGARGQKAVPEWSYRPFLGDLRPGEVTWPPECRACASHALLAR
eukprot:1143403-Pelagomonas_calceolata.AAC.1